MQSSKRVKSASRLQDGSRSVPSLQLAATEHCVSPACASIAAAALFLSSAVLQSVIVSPRTPLLLPHTLSYISASWVDVIFPSSCTQATWLARSSALSHLWPSSVQVRDEHMVRFAIFSAQKALLQLAPVHWAKTSAPSQSPICSPP